MRATLIVLFQLLLAFLVAGAVLPVVVLSTTRFQSGRVGPWVAIGLVALVFICLRVVWPKRRP